MTWLTGWTYRKSITIVENTTPSGTVTTNGTATVSGSGTNFTYWDINDTITIDGIAYTVTAIISNTLLTTSNIIPTGSSQSYTMQRKNYQLKVYVNYGSGTDSVSPTYQVYCNSYCNTDFSDVTFVNSAGTKIPFWVQNSVSSSQEMVWVSIPSIDSSIGATIYIYYGNSGQTTSDSNGSNTFIFFDDASANHSSSYTGCGADVFGYDATNKVYTSKEDAWMAWYATAVGLRSHIRAGVQVKFTNLSVSNQQPAIFLRYSSGIIYQIRYIRMNGWDDTAIFYGSWASSNGIGSYGSTFTPTQGVWYAMESTVFGSSLVDDICLLSGTVESHATATDTNLTTGNVGFALADVNSGNPVMKNFYVASYTSPEPTITAWGTEFTVGTIYDTDIKLYKPNIPKTYSFDILISKQGWLVGFNYRRSITVYGTNITGTLSNFPILIHLSASSGRGTTDVSSIFTKLGTNKLKIAITTDDGMTQCYVEIEKWDSVNNVAWLWFKAPSIPNGISQVFYLYYDPDAEDNTSYVGAVGSTPAMAVWDSNFLAVFHMIDGIDTTHIYNSVDGASRTKTGAGTPENSLAGIIGDCQYKTIGCDIDIGTDPNINLKGTGMTLECWAKTTTLSESSGNQRIISKHGSYTLRFVNNKVNCEAYFFLGNFYHATGATTLTQGVWYYLTGIYDGGHIYVYFNATQDGSYALSSSIDDSNVHDTLLTTAWDSTSEPWYGYLDEVRLSKTARSQAWISASYYSGLDSLLTYGTETANITTKTITYSIGTLFKVLNLPTTYDIDVLLQNLAIQAVYDVDIWLQTINVPATYTVDAVLKLFNIEKTRDIDMLLVGQGSVTYDIDTWLTRLGIPVDAPIDALLEKFDVEKDDTIDVLLVKLAILTTDSVDVLFKKLSKISGYSINLGIEKYPIKPYWIDILFKKFFLTKSYNLDTILAQRRKLTSESIDLILNDVALYLLKGRTNAVKTSIMDRITAALAPTNVIVIDAWRMPAYNFDSFSGPLCSVKIGLSKQQKLSYGEYITRKYFGTYFLYTFSIHVIVRYDPIPIGDAEIESQTAYNLANKIITYLRTNNVDEYYGVLDTYQITARESDPSGGAHKGAHMARIIIDGYILAERPWKNKRVTP